METISNSSSIPGQMPPATYHDNSLHTGSRISSILEQWTGWQITLTVLILLMTYDQSARRPSYPLFYTC